MEGKTLILSVLILSLFMAQIQVDAKSCCPTTTARNIYNVCRLTGSPRERCASLSGCKIVSGSCPNGYNKDILENTNDAVSEYCNVGCVSSVCGALTTLQNSDASEIVNGAVNKCVSACSTVCTKSSMNAVETA
ncbi:PREDICTED: probable thionin-2.4 [Camelina sativa]|uniref:Probable thionin-2.4 n=1 Tax=Camelina sativa TaxID=90675 RepID=A0ABM0WK22_CAMSA|nr:PREDICTED: probable thionin-2.4 [Camelina sativa]